MRSPETHPPLSGRHRSPTAAMRFIMVTVLIDMIAVGLIIPVLPGLVGSLTSNPQDQALWFGVVTVTFSLANFLGLPILGPLSDAYGMAFSFCPNRSPRNTGRRERDVSAATA